MLFGKDHQPKTTAGGVREIGGLMSKRTRICKTIAASHTTTQQTQRPLFSHGKSIRCHRKVTLSAYHPVHPDRVRYMLSTPSTIPGRRKRMSGAIVRRTGTFAKNFAHPGKGGFGKQKLPQISSPARGKEGPRTSGATTGARTAKTVFYGLGRAQPVSDYRS